MQAFESVIPSERTRVAVKIVDGSIRTLAPTHPGAVVLYVSELDFTTDIIGDSPETSFHFSVPSISLLLIDHIPGSNESATVNQQRAPPVSGGPGRWKVRSVVNQVRLKLTAVYRQ